MADRNRSESKDNKVRPRKAAGAKRRRQLEQRRRLLGLGMPETAVSKMNARQIRDLLKYPKKVTDSLAAAK